MDEQTAADMARINAGGLAGTSAGGKIMAGDTAIIAGQQADALNSVYSNIAGMTKDLVSMDVADQATARQNAQESHGSAA